MRRFLVEVNTYNGMEYEHYETLERAQEQAIAWAMKGATNIIIYTPFEFVSISAKITPAVGGVPVPKEKS